MKRYIQSSKKFLKRLPVVNVMYRKLFLLKSRFLVRPWERYDGDDPRNTEKDKAYFRAYFHFCSERVLPEVSGRVLDLGCGLGFLTKMIAGKKEVGSVLAIDKHEDLSRAQQDPKIVYFRAHLPEVDIVGKFDTVVATEFIEHISECDFRTLTQKIKTWLQPKGLFIGTTPGVPKDWRGGSRYHVREYNKEELKRLLEEYFPDVEIEDTGVPEEHKDKECEGIVTRLVFKARVAGPV